MGRIICWLFHRFRMNVCDEYGGHGWVCMECGLEHFKRGWLGPSSK